MEPPDTRKRSLGKVFISHSSKDKSFVRRLAESIWHDGYQVWLDEKELVPGDALAERLSIAIRESKVICVVVSKHSVASAWVKFELNKATGLMVGGDCRIIPVLRGRTELPAELDGLLYADFRQSFASGYKAVRAALDREAESTELSDWFRLKALAESTFIHVNYASQMGEYESLDYETIELPGTEGRGDRTRTADAVLDLIESTDYRRDPLGESWWDEYRRVQERYGETYHLVASERSIDISSLAPLEDNSRVLVHVDSTISRYPEAFVFADLSRLRSTDAKKRVLVAARDRLAAIAREIAPRFK